MTSCHREQEEAFARGGTAQEEELLWRRGSDDCSYLEPHVSFQQNLQFFTVLTVALASESLGYERGSV